MNPPTDAGERPGQVHLLSKSLPRAGHHYVVALLSRLYGAAFDYCEFYQPSTEECCKSEPCTRFCAPERLSATTQRVSMQKSHDFQLADPCLEGGAGLKHVVMLRGFREAVPSEFKLFLIDRFAEFLAGHGISAREILRSHHKPTYRRALALIDQAGLSVPPAEVLPLINERFAYYQGFVAKWQGFVRRHPGNALLIRYDELVGEGRAAILDALVSMIGVPPALPVAEALAAEPPLTPQERQSEESRAAAGLVLAHRQLLDQFDFMLARSVPEPARDAAPVFAIPRPMPALGRSQLACSHLDFRQPPPSLATPGSQLCTADQCEEPAHAEWCAAMQLTPRFDRALWESSFVLEVLRQAGMLRPGAHGLGWGAGADRLSAVLARHGCTTLSGPEAAAGGSAQVDFQWSMNTLGRLGTLARGMQFALDALAWLRPGGIVVHTADFNVNSNFDTLDGAELCVFRRYDLERLAKRLADGGARLLPINFNPGGQTLDLLYDLPPFRAEPHLKERIGKFVVTSIGLVVHKPAT